MTKAVSARRISPPREVLTELRTALTDGETAVFDLLDRDLPDDWEIYLQPHLNGLRPDFVVMSGMRGIAVIEIKDWANVDPRAMGAAVTKLALYDQELEDVYCPSLNQIAGEIIPSRSARLVLTNITRSQLKSSAPSLASERKIVCSDDLSVKSLVPGVSHLAAGFAEAAVEDLRGWLEEPRCAQEQRYPLFKELNARQRALVGDGPGVTGMRRIKGTAGSGKSLVLAARGAHLAKVERKKGLITSFNLTLLHYLRDLAGRYPVPERNALINQNVTWMHFHKWCKRICYQAGLSPEYHALPWQTDFEGVMSTHLPALTTRALTIANPRYDFVLVDEGQDWHLDWWKTVQKAVRPGGEMMLVADRTQDMYGTGSKWTDEAMVGAGFRGAWASLDTSYRLPSSVIPRLREFGSRFIKTDAHLPEVDEQAELMGCATEWMNVDAGSEPKSCLEVVVRLHRGDIIGQRLAPPDIVLLVQEKRIGTACVDELDRRGYRVCHTFSLDDREERRLKQAFFRGDARIKATTFQSFKGFENSVMVAVITNASSEHALRGVYAALTRVKRHPEGSALMVVNSADELREFGSRWEPENVGSLSVSHSDSRRDHVVRIVTENGRALKFKSHSFEKE